MDLRNTKTPVLDRGDAEEKREEIRRYFNTTFTLDEQLYETLADDKAFYLRAEPLRHPLIFYFGHTATFYINKLIIAKIVEKRINPRFESMFAVGVDEMSWDDLNAANYDWPTVAEVKEYREQVRGAGGRRDPHTAADHAHHLGQSVLGDPDGHRARADPPRDLVGHHPPAADRDGAAAAAFGHLPRVGTRAENELLPVAGGHVVLGKPRNDPLYGWDNEYGRQDNDVWDFSASRYLVSNREFLGFVEDRGYEKEEYWTEEGWKWVAFSKARHPLFWIESAGGFKLRTMAEIIDMPWNWPVEVNYLEAKAFCNWLAAKTGKPIRLPTEAEWYRLRDLRDIPDQPYWEKAPGNINLEHWASSCPVDRFAFGEFFDIIGNVWQWTETPITGFDGFEIHPWYDDFSTPTFDTRHNLIKGGSWISTGNEATRDSRYAFRRHFFQHAGLRYVESEQPVVDAGGDVRDRRGRFAVLRGPLRPDLFRRAHFLAQCAAICFEHTRERPRRKALDLGCAVGRARSSWPANLTSSPASTSPPGSSASRCSSRRRASRITISPRKARSFPTTRRGSPIGPGTRRSTAWSSFKATPPISSRSSPVTT